MARKKIRTHLTVEEYSLLNYITTVTKTDCWFALDQDDEGYDCVYDLENRRQITLRYAMQQLNEAIVPELLSLEPSGKTLYASILDKLCIRSNPFTNM